MSRDYFQHEGRHILENDELYIAGKDDIRYRDTGGPKPDLQDPGYWQDKLMDFYSYYFRGNQTSAPLVGSVSPSSKHSKGSASPATQCSRLSQRVREKCPPMPLHISPSTSPTTSIPSSQAKGTPVIERPGGSKRKSIHLDHTDQAGSHPLSQPCKRTKLGTGLADKVSTTAMENLPFTSEQLKENMMLYHRRSSGQTYDRLRQFSEEPDVIEELGNRATRTTSQRCRRQRKTYTKERASRRLVGQLPEFGMLPERGQKEGPHKDGISRKLKVTKAKLRKVESNGSKVILYGRVQ